MKITLLIILLSIIASAVSAGEFPFKPWTPTQLRGKSVSCWGRTYSFEDSLLPSAIISQKDDILARPMTLEASVGGRRIEWKDAEFKSIKAGAEAVKYATSAKSGLLEAVCTYSTEFDGTTRVDLKVRSDKEIHLDRLDLVVPLKTEYATLFHHSSIYPVYVWDWPKKRINSGSVDKSGMKLPFVFHIWLGNDDRGLQIFSESDEAWSPADPKSAVTVTPGRKESELRMNLLNDFRLKGSWKWTFGFIATPVKPYTDDRKKIRYCQMGGYGIDKISYGGVPVDKDHPALLDVYKSIGVNYLGFHENWSDQQSLPRPKNPEDLISLVNACHSKGIGLVTYTGCYMSTRSPEYSKDWDVMPFGDHYQYQRPDNGDICRVVCNNSGWLDLLVSSYTKAFKKWGLDGVYMDGFTCPLACSNTKHGCGYVGTDGQVHPTMPIWKTREAMKGFYKLIKNREKPGIMVSHMSSSVLLLALSFADTYLDGEHLLAYMTIGSKEYPESILRAEMSGHNFGIPGTQLPTRGGNKVEQERARTVCLLNDILMTWSPEYQSDIWRAFDSFGASEVQWVPYWKIGTLVKSSNPNFKISAYIKQGHGALFVVANLGDSAESTTLSLLPGIPGSRTKVKDESTGSELKISNGSVTVSVDPGTFKMVSVK